MATSQMGKVIHQLQQVILRQDAEMLTDGQLLESFIKARDEAALETLVRRNGPMVWAVCRRVLRNHHDAEDAFQATFLVLVRRAHSIVPRTMVRSWLYGVARKTALKACANSAKRNERERQATEMREPAAAENERPSDWQSVLDQEICALPQKYRAVLLLCDLESKTRKEAARQLGWPEGTVAGRLATARSMLAKRLARRGLAVTGGTLIAALAENGASASVPAPILAATIHSAHLISTGHAAASVVSAQVAALTEGVMKTMLLTKLKTIATVGLLATLIALGGGLLAQQGEPVERAKAGQEAPPPEAQRIEPRPIPRITRVTFPVADLVMPIQGLDGNDAEKTKEDWLIRKIMRTVAPQTWEGRGGNGSIEYFPLGKALVIKNTQEVQERVAQLLATMRRVQDVQVVVELKLISIRRAFFPKLRETFPNLKKDGHLVLNEAELLAILTKSQSDRGNSIVQAPKISMFTGQRAVFRTDKLDVTLMALVAANLQTIDLDLNAKFGAVRWSKTTRLAEGASIVLAADAEGDRTLLLLATPSILIATDEPLVPTDAKVIPAAAIEVWPATKVAPESVERRLVEALMKYEQACEANRPADARRWAERALDIDPTCFQKMLKRKVDTLDSRHTK